MATKLWSLLKHHKHYIANFLLQSVGRRTVATLAAFEHTAQSVLCARNHFSAVLHSHWALEIIARACREATLRSNSRCGHVFLCSAALGNAAPSLLFQTFRSNSWLGRSRQPLGRLEQAPLDSIALSSFW